MNMKPSHLISMGSKCLVPVTYSTFPARQSGGRILLTKPDFVLETRHRHCKAQHDPGCGIVSSWKFFKASCTCSSCFGCREQTGYPGKPQLSEEAAVGEFIGHQTLVRYTFEYQYLAVVPDGQPALLVDIFA